MKRTSHNHSNSGNSHNSSQDRPRDSQGRFESYAQANQEGSSKHSRSSESKSGKNSR